MEVFNERKQTQQHITIALKLSKTLSKTVEGARESTDGCNYK
jgi:hypothetical protein